MENLDKDETLASNIASSDITDPVFKGTLMQIWKSTNIFVYIWKYHDDDFRLKHVLLFEMCAKEICEKFVYKHSETIDYVKN